jgi:hypothetical protein
VVLARPARSDRAERPPWYLGAHLTLDGPTGAHADRLGADNLGVGLSWRLGVCAPWRWLPMSAGIDFGFAMRDWSTDRRPLLVVLPEGPRPIGEVEITRKSGSVHAFAELAAQSPWGLPGGVFPYAEALLGVRHFLSQTDVVLRSQEEPATLTDAADTALTAGYGAGLRIRAGSATLTPPGVRRPAFLTIGFRRLRGGRATYLAHGSDADGRLIAHRTRTDAWTFLLGIAAATD